MNSRTSAAILILSVIILIAGGLFLIFTKRENVPVPPISDSTNKEEEITRNLCLGLEKDITPLVDRSTDRYFAKIYIRDRKDHTPLEEVEPDFTIKDVASSVFAVQVRNCGVYVIRGFDYDKFMGFYKKYELWKYDFTGQGEVVMPAVEFKKYAHEFEINDSETRISLRTGVPGSPDYAIVIKELKTLNDVFVLDLNKLMETYPITAYPVELGSWSTKKANNKEYFKVFFFEPGTRLEESIRATLKIEAGTWNVEVMEGEF